uniref:PHM7_cyt domain-containing protein n=1 Tax=Ascaris lumbricoides TaxID=6252 RepID=A0A0M3IRG8_ASCLU
MGAHVKTSICVHITWHYEESDTLVELLLRRESVHAEELSYGFRQDMYRVGRVFLERASGASSETYEGVTSWLSSGKEEVLLRSESVHAEELSYGFRQDMYRVGRVFLERASGASSETYEGVTSWLSSGKEEPIFISVATNMDSVTKVAWYNDYCGVSACLTAVVLFSYCWPIANFFSSKFGALLHRGTVDEDEIDRIEAELREERRQLGLLSPTAQFAAYFKKDRYVNRLESQYKALVSKRQKATFATSIALKVLFISVCYVAAIALMFYSRHVQVGTIDCTYFWPFSFLLRTPNIGTLEGDSEECPVTLFAILILCNFVWRNAASADEDKSKNA